MTNKEKLIYDLESLKCLCLSNYHPFPLLRSNLDKLIERVKTLEIKDSDGTKPFMHSLISRTDGLSICTDCIHFQGPYIKCVFNRNSGTSCYPSSCEFYKSKEANND